MAEPVDAVRTPDERFTDLPGWPHEPSYAEWQGLRLARYEVGEGPDVVLLHGEPTWAYLWRRVVPPLAEAGFRCVLPDLVGFGRSDKPTELGWYSYDRHVEAVAASLQAADVRDATFVVHDWGGPIGMRVAAEHPELWSRLVVLDTGFFDGRQRMTDAWKAFRDFVERTEDLPIGFLVKGATARGLEDDVVAAYEAPFPDAASKAGARAFPLMLPTDPSMPGAAESARTREAIAAADKPKLVLWADADPIIPLAVGERMAEVLGAEGPETVEQASHFLQEDAGEELGRRIVRWLLPTSA